MQEKEWQMHVNNAKQHIKKPQWHQKQQRHTQCKGKADGKNVEYSIRATNQNRQCHTDINVPSNDVWCGN